MFLQTAIFFWERYDAFIALPGICLGDLQEPLPPPPAPRPPLKKGWGPPQKTTTTLFPAETSSPQFTPNLLPLFQLLSWWVALVWIGVLGLASHLPTKG